MQGWEREQDGSLAGSQRMSSLGQHLTHFFSAHPLFCSKKKRRDGSLPAHEAKAIVDGLLSAMEVAAEDDLRAYEEGEETCSVHVVGMFMLWHSS